MAEQPPRGLLRQETYLYLGQQNRGLLREVFRRDPDARGAEIALAVLELLDVGEATAARSRPARFFKDWLRQRGGEEPASARRRDRFVGYLTGGDDGMEAEHWKWVGLGLIVALVGGGVVWAQLAKRRGGGPPAPLQQPPRPAPPKPQPVRWRLAVGVFSGKLRDRSLSAKEVADVLALAPYWWVGQQGSWSRVESSAELQSVDGLPESDDALVVVVLDAVLGPGDQPSSRPEAASQFRAAADRGNAEVMGIFVVRDGAELPADFRR